MKRFLGVSFVLVGAFSGFGCAEAPESAPTDTSQVEDITETAQGLTCATLRRGGLGDGFDAVIAFDPADPTRASANLGSGILVQAGAAGSATTQTLLRFDLSPIPAAATVVSATLTLNKFSSPGLGTVFLHRATAPWAESSVSWSSFGGAFLPGIEATIDSAVIPNGSLSLDLTAAVQAWTTGTAPNHGLVLEQPGGGRTSFAASDASVLSVRPRLAVCYALTPTCSDGVQNGLETGVDCGGSCAPCPSCIPAPEVCNGLDDDCDGLVDQNNPGGGLPCSTGLLGACDTGATACSSGVVVCGQAVTPAAEACNGVDDDCNGQVDELGATACGVGACAATVTTCVGGALSTCVPGAPTAEICDGLFDEDCDGAIDNGCACLNGTTQSCYSGAPGTLAVGLCGAGVQTCVGGQWGACAGEVVPQNEACNGLDDDCDGAVDQGNPGGGAGCSTGAPGICAAGTVVCAGGALTCQGLLVAHAETCDGLDEDCDGSVDEGVTTTFYADADADGAGNAAVSIQACFAPAGYGTDASDCNDAVSTVFPGAAESCNGVDDDCDGAIDEGVKSTFYADADGDGFGNAGATTQACAVPAGYVANAGDCNDAAGSAFPGAPEACNGADDDCDGAVDEGVKSTFYADVDGDGYGNPASTTQACSAPSGYVANAADCNDGTAGIKPGAAETCNGVDDDCDGATDEGVTTTYWQDADGDGFGNPAAALAACALPSGYVSNASDCNDTKFSVKPGGVEVCNALDDNCNGQIDELVTFTFYKDTDGDGYGTAVTTQACSAPVGFAALSGDCNDGNANINPGTAEVCNLVDDNCDGQVDEGDPGGGAQCATGLPGACSTGSFHCVSGSVACVQDTSQTWYLDSDDDGYGVTGSKKTQCTQPVGYAPLGADCDDTDEEINPGAVEVCNTVDDNCDGSIDNNVPNPSVWYLDADGDGYGASSPTVAQCTQPAGYSPSGGDCNDGSAAVSPGAAESCNGADDNCNGVSDEGNPNSGASCSTGLAGVCSAGTTACFNGALICNQTNASGFEVCNAKDDDCDGATDEGGVCICITGQTQSCYGGPAGTLGVGVCAAGTQTCTAGVWGACVGAVVPGVENCAKAPDEDCDGLAPACSGAALWAQKFGGSSSDPAYGIAVDAQGNTYITGYFQGTANFGSGSVTSAGSYDIFLIKLNAAGAYVWSKTFGGANQDIGYDVAVDAAGNVFLAGVFRSPTINLGGSTLSNAGSTTYYDALLAKFDANGVHQWSKRFGGTNHDYGYSVEVDKLGNVVLGGYFASTGSVTFGGSTFATAGSYDPYVAKFDTNGNHLWSNKWGSSSADYGYDLAVGPSNEVIITGGFQGTVNFGGGSLVSAGAYDAYVLKLDQNGGFVQAKRFGDSDTQYGYSVAVDGSGNILLAGVFQSKIDLGGGNLTASTSYYDMYVARFDSNVNYTWAKSFGNGSKHDYAYGCAFDPAGNAVVSGYFQSTIDFGGGTLTSAGSYDLAIVKLDTAGGHVYSKRFGNSSAQYGRRVKVDTSGNTLWVGYFQSSVDFGLGSITSAGSNDIFVAKLAP